MTTLTDWFAKGYVPVGDDPYHDKAVQDGLVPQACLMGGTAIWSFHEKGIDICQLCHWRRELCGGRPMRKDGVIETKYDAMLADHSMGGAKRMTFDLWVKEVQRQVADGPPQRRGRY